MAIDQNQLIEAMQQFIQADADEAASETAISNAQADHTRKAQLREEAKQKIITLLGQ